MKPVFVSFDVVRIADTEDATTKEIRAFAEDVAARLQDVIAEEFEQERTFKGALKMNTDAYTDSKVAAGLDPRRGHREGGLQEALHSEKLWRVSGTRILFSEGALIKAVDYATYYAESKARGGVIVGVKKAWVAAVAAQVRSKKRRIKKGAGSRQIKISGSLVNIKQRGIGSEVRLGV